MLGGGDKGRLRSPTAPGLGPGVAGLTGLWVSSMHVQLSTGEGTRVCLHVRAGGSACRAGGLLGSEEWPSHRALALFCEVLTTPLLPGPSLGTISWGRESGVWGLREELRAQGLCGWVAQQAKGTLRQRTALSRSPPWTPNWASGQWTSLSATLWHPTPRRQLPLEAGARPSGQAAAWAASRWHLTASLLRHARGAALRLPTAILRLYSKLLKLTYI